MAIQLNKRVAQYIKSDEREKPTTKNTIPSNHSDLMERSKFYRKAKAKRVQHHQTIFTTIPLKEFPQAKKKKPQLEARKLQKEKAYW